MRYSLNTVSSFHRYVVQGIYSADWGMEEELIPLLEDWKR